MNRKTLKQRIADAEAVLGRKQPQIKVPTFDAFWSELSTPEGAFIWDGAEAGEWQPYWCDDCNTFHKTAGAIEFGRTSEGKRYVISRTCDEDGNWDIDDSFEDGDSEQQWQHFYTYCLSELQSYEHFRAWANYHLWCAEHGGTDPLGEFFDGKPTPSRHVAAAEENVKYIEGILNR